ncbi:MAG: Type 1 glutamine amidotransferase-like domain-containing protein [Actinomycetota bacterium]|nr:Type 1 glutamine amidotransferase-like domain-containing protein [Actinomycetota bacterium]
MDITLVGGGWDVLAQTECLRPFLAAASSRAGASRPRVGLVRVDEADGGAWGERWAALLEAAGDLEPVSVVVPLGEALDPSRLSDLDGLFVCGGLTPAYAAALAPAAEVIRRLVLEQGVPYAGSSAGAAVAARRALVGGYLDGGRVVCPPDAAEDLEEVTVVAGLGLVEQVVDVHASDWGTLPRLATVLRRLPGTTGLGLDEDTAWHRSEGGTEVLGSNAVHVLEPDGDVLRWSFSQRR